MSAIHPAPPDIAAIEKRDRLALEQCWAPPSGFLRWFKFTTHQELGKRYIITAFLFLIAGGIEALLMRIQLSKPENNFLNPDLYNQVFTMHGTTMMFLFAVPVMEGLGVYLVPLMIGTRNVAFPRLNAFGYYMFLFGGLFLYAGFLLNIGPDAGWFAYTPLSGPQYSPGKRVDFWAQMITFTELSAIAVGIELIVTAFKFRAPGMSLNRIPLFVWAMLVQSFMVIFAMPAVMAASGLLLLDRLVGTHFFNPAEGGDPLLWQHLFWFFGHPEVYIIFIPATGIVSTLVVSSARRPIFGYTAVVLSLVSTGFIGFGLWVHHMFTTGLPQLGESYFTAASVMIAIPSGIQIFCWIATLWGGRLRFDTAFHFALGFIATFVLGGLTGVMVASVPFDAQVHDTFFVVAHFHYVLIGGAVFPLLGGIYHWFPKMTGRLLDERLGKLNFWLVFLGFHLTFFPMHNLGMDGMPRRVYTYTPETGWGDLNLLASIGAVIIALGGIVFLANVFRSVRRGRIALANPWGADTLEWSAPSPPPSYNWVHLPTVNSRYPLWTRTEDDPVVTGLHTGRREVLSTEVLSGRPDHRFELPGPSLWPVLTALAVSAAFIGSVFHPLGVVPGIVLAAAAVIAWLRPRPESEEGA